MTTIISRPHHTHYDVPCEIPGCGWHQHYGVPCTVPGCGIPSGRANAGRVRCKCRDTGRDEPYWHCFVHHRSSLTTGREAQVTR